MHSTYHPTEIRSNAFSNFKIQKLWNIWNVHLECSNGIFINLELKRTNFALMRLFLEMNSSIIIANFILPS